MVFPIGFHAWRVAHGNPYAGIEWMEECLVAHQTSSTADPCIQAALSPSRLPCNQSVTDCNALEATTDESEL